VLLLQVLVRYVVLLINNIQSFSTVTDSHGEQSSLKLAYAVIAVVLIQKYQLIDDIHHDTLANICRSLFIEPTAQGRTCIDYEHLVNYHLPNNQQ
jgi:hypothetical protein